MIPPTNFWWLLRPPTPCLHFLSKFDWSPLWILPKFPVIPPFGFSVTTDPPFCSPKRRVIPPKYPAPPPPQTINNDRSLTPTSIRLTDGCANTFPAALSTTTPSQLGMNHHSAYRWPPCHCHINANDRNEPVSWRMTPLRDPPMGM